MIKIRLICVGNIKEHYFTDAIEEYKKRMQKFFDFDIVELPESKRVKSNQADISLILKEESKNILPKLKGFNCALCINGKNLDSIEFANMIDSKASQNGVITFVIGSSHGLDESVINACDYKLSYSKMTFPHQLMRVVFMESLYRAGSILNNTPYHK